MQASDYLRMKFQSERQLAVYGQQGVISTWRAIKEIGTDIYAGVERVSWYSSCVIPGYRDVCQELIAEQKRMHRSVLSLYRYRNVISHMFRLYFETIIDDSKNGNPSGRVRSVNAKITKVADHVMTGRAMRLAIALSLANALAASELVTRVVIERLSRRVPVIVLAFQLIGTDQKCALAARRLKQLDPEYYQALYQAEIEMLYYFIEPVLAGLIKHYQMHFLNDFQGFHNYIKEVLHV